MQLLVRRPGEVDPEKPLIRERVTHWDPLSMVLYGISLYVPEEKIRGEFPGLIQSLYADDFSTEGVGAH